MDDHSPLPWFVHETKHPHHLGGAHTERRIFTVSIHPQLKDHDGVVNGSVGIGAIEGGPPVHMVSISAVDAAFIVKAVNNHAEAMEIIESLLGLELGSSERAMAFLSRVGGAREWDAGEHEGCGIDSQRAFDKFARGDKP